jgi:hypothetical protein
MEKLPDYVQAIEEGKSLVANHNKLLESLLLSRQANDNNLYTDETTNGIADGSLDAGEGFSQPGSQSPA